MLRRTFVLALISLLSTSTPVLAESVKDALKSFGLFGIWSVDCGRDQTKEPFVGRSIYTASSDGFFETFSLSMANGDIVSWRKTIKSAQVVDGRIEIISENISADSTNAAFNEQPERTPVKHILAKQGNKIVTLEAHSIDGKKIFIRSGELVLQSSQGVPIAGTAEISDRKVLPVSKCSK